MTTTARPKNRKRQVGWRSRDVVRTAALVMGLFLVAQLLWFAKELVLTAFVGILFGLAVGAGVDRLQRFGMRRGIAAVLIVLAFIGMLVGVGAWITPTLRAQSAELRVKIPEAVDRVEGWVGKRKARLIGAVVGDSTRAQPPAAPDSAASSGADSTATSTAPDESLRAHLGDQVSKASRYLFPFISHTFAVFAGVFLIIFISIYTATDPALYHRGLMKMFPERARQRAGDVLSRMAWVLRRWLVTQLFAMLTIGAATTILLMILRVKAALALGIIAGLLEFIPTVGPLLSSIPAIAMGFIDSPQKAIWVALVYVGLHFFESHLVIPLLMKGGIDLPPVLTILAQALFTLLFGFLGLMVAVPALAATMVAVKMLYVEDVVGEKPRPARAPSG